MTTTLLLRDPDLFRRQAYSGGLWCDADNGATLDVNNPATGEILGTVPLMGTAETRRAIDAAKNAWGDWRRKPAKDRSALLRKWYELMLANLEDVGKLMTGEQGKPLAEAKGEVAIVFDDADLKAAVEGAIISKYRNAGQTCVCANRLYVQAGAYDVFAEKLVA